MSAPNAEAEQRLTTKRECFEDASDRMWKLLYDRARNINSAVSLAERGYKAVAFLFPAAVMVIVGWVTSFTSYIWDNYGALGAIFVVLVAGLAASVIVLIGALSIYLVRMTASRAVRTKRINIDSAILVPFGDDAFSLVIDPRRGGISVEVFLDWSAWHAGAFYYGGGVSTPGWSAKQRFFLGAANLRAEGVKNSMKVLERNDAGIWCWKILLATGEPATTLPTSTSTKERITFLFIDKNAQKDDFSFILARAKDDWERPPIIIARDDFAFSEEAA